MYEVVTFFYYIKSRVEQSFECTFIVLENLFISATALGHAKHVLFISVFMEIDCILSKFNVLKPYVSIFPFCLYLICYKKFDI
jgi:hypothetical protein